MGGSAVMYSNTQGTFTIFGAAAGAWPGADFADYICQINFQDLRELNLKISASDSDSMP